MNTLNLKKYNPTPALWMMASILIWWMIDRISSSDLTIGSLDLGILQVIALAFAVWLLLLALGLAIIGMLLSKITQQLTQHLGTLQPLNSWEHHVLYLSLFAVLLFSGTGCLIAIC